MDTYEATAPRVLALPLVHNPSGCQTVADYLGMIVQKAWGFDFSAKYGFTGEDDWRYDLYRALIAGNLLDGVSLNEQSEIPDELDRIWRKRNHEADKLIEAAIRLFIQRGKGETGVSNA